MIYVLTGKISSGKSTFLLKFFENRNDVCAVIQIVRKGKRYFVELPERREYKMECESEDEEKITIGNYSFSLSAIRKANTKLTNCLLSDASVVVIDEFGKLEIEKKVFYNVITASVNLFRREKSRDLILVIRNNLLDEFYTMFNLEPNSIKVIEIIQAEEFFKSEFARK